MASSRLSTQHSSLFSRLAITQRHQGVASNQIRVGFHPVLRIDPAAIRLLALGQGRSLNSLLRFWQRLTKIAAFFRAGSSAEMPASLRASRKSWVFDKSGRDLLS